MELANSGYLYTLAMLAMSFVGFTAIVMILRQSLGAPLSHFDALVARFFMVWGFAIAYAAMLPPLLAAFDLPQPVIWRTSCVIMGLILITLSIVYPLLRRKATGERPPRFVYGQSAAGVILGLMLLADAAEPFRLPLGSAIYLAVLTFTLVQASVGFIITINVMLRASKRSPDGA
jgi:hypothetical protein